MWWKRPKEQEYVKMPRCPHCGRTLSTRLHKGIPVYLCPRDEELLQRSQQPGETPAGKALSIRQEQVTGPIDIRAMRSGDLMHYHRLMHPSPVDTREVRAIRLKNAKARRQ